MEVEYDDPDLERLEQDPEFTAGQSMAVVKGFRRVIAQVRAALDERDRPESVEGVGIVRVGGEGLSVQGVGVGERGSLQRGCIAGRGDPGNRATTTFVCEAPLALAFDAAALPGGAAFGGVLTPATAFGAVLAARLRRAGMAVEPLD